MSLLGTSLGRSMQCFLQLGFLACVEVHIIEQLDAFQSTPLEERTAFRLASLAPNPFIMSDLTRPIARSLELDLRVVDESMGRSLRWGSHTIRYTTTVSAVTEVHYGVVNPWI